MSEHESIFKFSPQEQLLTDTLQQIIIDEIKLGNGQIPFSRYMELALYYPGLGYYSNPGFKFGAKGDFITAPLVSNLFGYTLSRQLSELFEFGAERRVLEFGAGNGKLAADILSSIGDKIESYLIIELSADLKQVQRDTIANKVPNCLDKVVWLQELPTEFNGVMLANEVLDAQPCNLVRFDNNRIIGVGVGYDDNHGFSYRDYPLDGQTLELATQLRLGYSDYQTEIHLANHGFIRSLAASLNRGAIILIDYGYGEREYYHPQRNRGTLRGFFRQHLLDDILIYPGLIDITTSVNWTAVATTAIEGGLELIGYTNQANFLLNCGITEDITILRQQLSESQYLQLSNQVNRLTSLNEMGDVFKVIGFSKGLSADTWLGFINGDRSYSL